MNGFEVVRRLRETSALPVIALLRTVPNAGYVLDAPGCGPEQESGV
jgi:CheY-like chemotaxis protein